MMPTTDATLIDDGEGHPLAERSGYGANLKGTGGPTDRRERVVLVSYELLRELLKLPATFDVVAAADDPLYGRVALKVSSLDFDRVPDGDRVPELRLAYRMDHTRVGDHTEIRTVKLVGWE